MTFKVFKYSDLQTRLIEALESLIENRKEFEKRFTYLLKVYTAKDRIQIIPTNDYLLLCDHVFNTLEVAISTLKNKEIIEDDYKKVFHLIFVLIQTHPWITALSERNEKLRELANDCLQHLTSETDLSVKVQPLK